MKLVKTSAIAVAISALLAGPVLAQGASSGTQIRGGAQGKTQMQGGASGSVDEDTNAPAGAASQRAGAKTGMKGTVGAGSGAPKVTGGRGHPSGDQPIGTPGRKARRPPSGCSPNRTPVAIGGRSFFVLWPEIREPKARLDGSIWVRTQ